MANVSINSTLAALQTIYESIPIEKITTGPNNPFIHYENENPTISSMLNEIDIKSNFLADLLSK